jgi:hypothetical protein
LLLPLSLRRERRQPVLPQLARLLQQPRGPRAQPSMAARELHSDPKDLRIL